MAPPLNHLKILDFTYLLPGPYGTMILADMGADIIKVENGTNPDLMRVVQPEVEGVSAAYAQINRGKKSLALDLKKKDAVKIVHELLEEYDIVIEQFRPGVMSRLGLGYEDLKKINSRIIYCSLTGYGQTGTYASRAGHDINYLALSGLESYSGRKESGPSLSGLQVADVAAGSKNLVIAVLAAFINRMETDTGEYIDISITDSTFAMTAFTAAGVLAGAPEPGREADLLNGGTLYDYYETADNRYISIGAIEQKFFHQFCDAAGCEDLKENGILNVSAKNRLAEIICAEPLEYWVDLFRGIDACVEPVLGISETMSRPPLSERDMIVAVPSATGSRVMQIGNPIKFSSGECCADMAGVSLGYHTGEIMTSLGYSAESIATLKEEGVIFVAGEGGNG